MIRGAPATCEALRGGGLRQKTRGDSGVTEPRAAGEVARDREGGWNATLRTADQ
jgi:hypothetical protein